MFSLLAQAAEKALTPTPAPTPEKIPEGAPAVDFGQQLEIWVAKIIHFFRYEFFANLPYYLILIFLVVLAVLVFAGLNIAVRFITDPIFHKVFRIKESSKIPAVIGGIITAVIALFVLNWIYQNFPTLKPYFEGLWVWAAILTPIGIALQLIGHRYEGKPPSATNDWRFLIIGVAWWVRAMRGKA